MVQGNPRPNRAQAWPFQEIGAQFLAQRAGALLLDEPGLGKSCQAVKAADYVGAARRLILCPASARENWRREVNKFSAERRIIDVAYSATHVFSHMADTWVVNYDLVHDRRMMRQLRAWAPQVVVADEAHLLKNPEARRTQAVLGEDCARLKGVMETAAWAWALSGTPMPNNVLELFPLMRAFTPDALRPAPGMAPMTQGQFEYRYADTVQGPYGLKVIGTRNLPDLRARLAGAALRRLKAQVLPELPPFAVYVTHLSSPDAVTQLHAAAAGTPGVQELIAALAAATMLNSPQAIQEALAEYAPHLASLRRITGILKAPLVAQAVADDLDGGVDKIVIMGVHRDVLDVLSHDLARFNPQVLHGGTPPRKRQEAIDAFQRDPAARVFVGQVQAAGTAITLTAACEMVFAETAWVPGDNDQAAQRIHRIGQSRPVRVRIPTLAGTVDEVVARAVRRKMKDISAVLD